MMVHRKCTTEYCLFDNREVSDDIWDALKHSSSPLGAAPVGLGFPIVSVSYPSDAAYVLGTPGCLTWFHKPIYREMN